MYGCTYFSHLTCQLLWSINQTFPLEGMNYRFSCCFWFKKLQWYNVVFLCIQELCTLTCLVYLQIFMIFECKLLILKCIFVLEIASWTVKHNNCIKSAYLLILALYSVALQFDLFFYHKLKWKTTSVANPIEEMDTVKINY